MAATLLAAPQGPTAVYAEAADLETAVKAAYLDKLAPFVTWPASSFSGPRAPLFLCIAGEDPFGRLLDRVVREQRRGGRPVVVRRLRQVERGAPCHILYLAGSAAQSAGEGLQAVRGDPVLTVTDEARGDQAGDARGVIHFMVRNDRVRMSVDPEAAGVNGLTLSSKLIALAAPRGTTP